jgi:uncharacterized protein (UPF0332 family)
LISELTKKYIAMRLEEAKDSLHEADTLYSNQLYRGVYNRSYYAMFYCIHALMALKGEGSSKHKYVLSYFDRNFIHTNVFPKETSKNLHELFNNRQVYDYGEVLNLDPEEAKASPEKSRAFVGLISEYIRHQIDPQE